MLKNRDFSIIIVFVLMLFSCGSKSDYDSVQLTGTSKTNQSKIADTLELVLAAQDIVVGANQTHIYLPLLEGKRVGLVANQTSIVVKKSSQNIKNSDYIHLVDTLLESNIDIIKVFAPEHGFRGLADAGEFVKDGIDTKTNIPIISLYGKNKKPSPKQLEGLDIVVFDIQDVGARFYTYISSLHYVMEACAEAHIPVIVLDRPNPNGHYIDGPILEPQYKSFVGMHPIPVVHGMTIGEYARMINGENWLDNKAKCDLTIIEMKNYNHNRPYRLPIKPSPNLPNSKSINLYPSLCFFEGTTVNAGRGTSKQFQIYGSPYLDKTVYNFKYIPMPNVGAKYPKHKNVLCYGENLSNQKKLHKIDLSFLIKAYENSIDKTAFFNDYFTTLAGTKTLELQIKSGASEQEIKDSWKDGLSKFKNVRSQYTLY